VFRDLVNVLFPKFRGLHPAFSGMVAIYRMTRQLLPKLCQGLGADITKPERSKVAGRKVAIGCNMELIAPSQTAYGVCKSESTESTPCERLGNDSRTALCTSCKWPVLPSSEFRGFLL
jgi:hypothetical protein